ncbi:hypothetical protein GDO86_000225 [Hymenochirus boettgeri]|uniref:Uncharacterized protein n=1 Tax=Hymenochirus boettgeri TaxID=247094 RepID=A0A8T2KB59_9PIPI|nr:hypothetical protein GDO86_000225 [Hymenochirus boettgeri]
MWIINYKRQHEMQQQNDFVWFGIMKAGCTAEKNTGILPLPCNKWSQNTIEQETVQIFILGQEHKKKARKCIQWEPGLRAKDQHIVGIIMHKYIICVDGTPKMSSFLFNKKKIFYFFPEIVLYIYKCIILQETKCQNETLNKK